MGLSFTKLFTLASAAANLAALVKVALDDDELSQQEIVKIIIYGVLPILSIFGVEVFPADILTALKIDSKQPKLPLNAAIAANNYATQATSSMMAMSMATVYNGDE